MTKIEIINETVAFYTTGNKRSLTIDNEYCVYNGPKGTHCAVGRCMLTKYKRIKTNNRDWNEGTAVGVLASKLTNGASANVDSVLAKKYRGHDIRFWNQLQDFHDTDRYWDGERLTAEGDGAVVNLLATWSGRG